LTEDTPTTTVCIEVPLKRDRKTAEEQRQGRLVAILYGLGGVFVLALFLFIGYRLFYP
jgi:hypothetical protein